MNEISTDEEYEAALKRVDALWDAKENTPEHEELHRLAGLIDRYEREQEAKDNAPCPK